MYTAMDARRKVLGSTEREPEPGRNLVLTIDENIQFMAERALDHAMEKTQALNGTVVVQDVHTGQILALAIRPTFNPNQFRHTTPDLLRDHAVSDVYEPGSAFKLVTYSAAMDQHVATPDDMIDCQGGKITLAGRVIHDDQGEHFGVDSGAQGARRVQRRGRRQARAQGRPRPVLQYIRDFGFGTRSGVELPGETRGLLRPVNRWSPRPSVPSPSARRSPSRRCNWSRWFRPSPMAACICRRTSSCRIRRSPPRTPTKRLPHRRWRSCRSSIARQARRRSAQSAAEGAHRVISTWPRPRCAR